MSGRAQSPDAAAPCSQGGKHKYPYGDDYVEGKCGGPATPGTDPTTTAPKAATDSSACRGDVAPFSEVLNMVGNAREWEDHCRTEVLCTTRGGGANLALGTGDPPFDCTQTAVASLQGHIDVGIRCCADYK